MPFSSVGKSLFDLPKVDCFSLFLLETVKQKKSCKSCRSCLKKQVDLVKTMKHKEITHQIIGCTYQVFNGLGFGFLESVYKQAMIIELKKKGLAVQPERPLRVYYDNKIVGEFLADLFVENEIVVELKSVQNIVKDHEVQLVNYLNAIKKDIGLLVNFGPSGVVIKRKYREYRQNDKELKA